MHKETIMKMLAGLDLNSQFDLLTSIEILTNDAEIIRHCRDIRNEIAVPDKLPKSVQKILDTRPKNILESFI